MRGGGQRPDAADTESEQQEQEQQQQKQQQQQQHQRQQSQQYFAVLETLRSHRSSLQSEGVHGFDLFEQMATLALRYRTQEQRTNRCSSCWYDTEIRCVCDKMPSRLDNLPAVKFLLLMHHREYLNAGNSAKVLLAMLPEDQIELYVYGRVGDLDRLVEEIQMDPIHTLTLWPGRQSRTIEEFIKELPADSFWKRQTGAWTQATNSEDTPERESLLRVVVLDGTYTNAKNMHKNLQKRLGDQAPTNIALHPKEVSQFHRAQKRYGASIAKNLKTNADLDERALRISTAEACGLLLVELGAAVDVQEKIVEAVLLNNVEHRSGNVPCEQILS